MICIIHFSRMTAVQYYISIIHFLVQMVYILFQSIVIRWGNANKSLHVWRLLQWLVIILRSSLRFPCNCCHVPRTVTQRVVCMHARRFSIYEALLLQQYLCGVWVAIAFTLAQRFLGSSLGRVMLFKICSDSSNAKRLVTCVYVTGPHIWP